MPSHVSLLLIVAALGVCAYGAERRTEFPFGGKWITAQSGQGNYRPALRLSREFVVEKPVKRAVLGATALGLYVPYVNGREITARRMMPGWTQYERRVPSQEFDVTEFLRPGTNVVSALVGDGWYCSQISYVAAAFAQHEGRTGWGRHPRFRAELRIEYSDGAAETNSTDRTWKSFYMDPATLANDIYQGEEYDAEIEDEKWKLPGCSRLWTANGVREVEESAEIVGDIGQPVVVTRELKPVKIERRPSGAYILDFGENIAGVDRIRLAKPHPGAVIVVRHGEDLDRDGNLWRGNLAFAGAKTVLTCGPKAPFEYSPRFTFFGYRYAEVSGWPADEKLTPDSVNALVLSAAVKPTGSFACSNELLNSLYANVRRSQQANFIDVPTDCPQRCERFGWTGDAQIFAETAMMNYDVRRFFVKWMGDVRLCAGTSGAFPDIAPWPDQGFDTSKSTGSAGWADVGVVVPWMLYRKYGDCDALREAYPSIVKYVDLIASAEKLGTIGDHLNLDQPTSTAYLAEALRIEMHRLAALAARALGETEDAKRFAARREQLLARFRAKHLGADGLPKERTQTAAAFSIVYGIAPDDAARRATVGLLKELIAERDGHLATGFLGTPVLLRALTEAGEIKTAYKLLETTTFPSWLYPVTQGATTIWERWNAKVDGKFNSDWMNSLNHYAYGSVVAWFYDTIVGIRDLTEENPEWAGFRRFRLAPQPGGTLTYAKATHEIPGGGVISSAWELKDGHVEWVFEVPEGSEAEVVLPGKLLNALPKGIAIKENLLLAKSGRYTLVCEKAGEVTFGGGPSAASGPTKVMFFFDTEDFTCDESSDAIRETAKILTEEGVRGEYNIVGYLARELVRLNRRDVIEALKPHAIGTQTLKHSVHPTVCERSDMADYETAYRNVFADESEGVGILKAAFGLQHVDYAVPPGNSWSYASLYVFADLGMTFYGGGGFGDMGDRKDASEGLIPPGLRRWGMWYCNLLQLPYGHVMPLEELIPCGTDWKLPDFDKVLEQAAKRDFMVFALHPHMAIKTQHWDGPNYLGHNRVEWGKWIQVSDRPAKDTAAFYRNFRAFVRRIKSDPRFEVTDTFKEKSRLKPRVAIRLSDVPAIRRSLGKDFGAVSDPASWCLYDVFQAVAAFLRGEKTYMPCKAYGFLDRPEGVAKPTKIRVEDLRAAAANLPRTGFLPSSIKVGEAMIGPRDFLSAGLEVLETNQATALALPCDQLGSFSNCPSLETVDIKGGWCIHSPALDGKLLDERLKLQLWTLRYE